MIPNICESELMANQLKLNCKMRQKVSAKLFMICPHTYNI